MRAYYMLKNQFARYMTFAISFSQKKSKLLSNTQSPKLKRVNSKEGQLSFTVDRQKPLSILRKNTSLKYSYTTV